MKIPEVIFKTRIGDIEALGGASIGFKFPHLFQIDFTYRGMRNRNIPKIHLCYFYY